MKQKEAQELSLSAATRTKLLMNSMYSGLSIIFSNVGIRTAATSDLVEFHWTKRGLTKFKKKFRV